MILTSILFENSHAYGSFIFGENNLLYSSYLNTSYVILENGTINHSKFENAVVEVRGTKFNNVTLVNSALCYNSTEIDFESITLIRSKVIH